MYGSASKVRASTCPRRSTSVSCFAVKKVSLLAAKYYLENKCIFADTIESSGSPPMIHIPHLGTITAEAKARGWGILVSSSSHSLPPIDMRRHF